MVSSSQSAWSEMTSGSSTLRWRARWRIRIQPDAIAVTGSGSRRDQRSLSAPGGAMTIWPAISCLGRAGRVWRSSPSVDAEALVELVQPLDRAVEIDRVVMAARAQLADDPLRLAERIGADQHAAARVGVQAVEQPVDLAAGVGMAEHRQAEGRLGDEDVAGHRHEQRAGRVGAALVVAGDDDLLALMLEHDLRGAEHVAGGNEADVDLADADALAIGDRLPALRRRSGTSMIASVSGVASTAPWPPRA